MPAIFLKDILDPQLRAKQKPHDDDEQQDTTNHRHMGSKSEGRVTACLALFAQGSFMCGQALKVTMGNLAQDPAQYGAPNWHQDYTDALQQYEELVQ